MSEILRRLGIDTAGKEERPFVSEDFVFDPAAYVSGKELRVAHEEVYLEETPLALLRQIHLQHATHAHASLTLRLALCWNGFRDALMLIARYSQSFQRAIPVGAVVNTAEKYGTGDLGFAWPWSGEGDPDVLAFVRNNLFVSIQGHDAAAIVVPLARELDESLRKLRTGGAYGEDTAGLLAEVRRRVGENPWLPAGGRLDFGVLEAGEGSTLFFLSTIGSVNRAPERTDSWYYRAGAEKGRQDVVLLRVGKGILPIKERLTVEIA